jgi:hypothetical protein
MSRRSIASSVALTLGLIAFGSDTLHAQSYAQQVWDQLQIHYKTIAKNSSDWFLRNYVMGKLKNDATDSWTFYFDEDKESILTAACDNDCSDVDLTVKDSDGKTVAHDTQSDDTPVVRFQPKSSGRYTIDIQMVKCKDEPCYFGFGVFQK